MDGPKPSTPPRGLTAAFVESLRPAAQRYDVADRRTPGLRLRVLPSSKRVFRWHCTARGKVITIGPWSLSEEPGSVTLAQAREWLERLKAAHAAGTLETLEAELDAHLRRRARVADPAPESRRLFRAVAEEFYSDDILKNRKRPEDARDVLDRDLLPALGARPLDEITTLDCRDVIKRVVARGAPVHAGKVLATLKQLFNWAQANGFTDRNPSAPLRGRHIGVEVNVSDRFLATEEIPIFWAALDAAAEADRPAHRRLHPATAAGLRLLLLTAARTGELLLARWEHVDLKAATWTVPIENQKLTRTQERRAKPFVIPLAPAALALVEELQGLAGKSPWVMASRETEDGQFTHFTDKALGRAMRRLQEGDEPVLELPGGEASPHDLRRTARTHLGKLRVPLHIVERCLNHSLGRIVQTYDVGDYLDERREALERWAAYVQGLVTPPAAKVIPITEGAR
jgi:integrase